MKKIIVFTFLTLLFWMYPQDVQAMHIGEGFLPLKWCIIYFVLCIPFFIVGIRSIKKKTEKQKEIKMLLGLVAAYVFIFSAMKIPSITGSSSHPTGVGFGAILFGPFEMSVISLIVLIFQALLLAHGGITTLGANTFSMGIVGAFVSFSVFKLFKNKNKSLAIFLGAALGDLATYIATSIQLGVVFSNDSKSTFEAIMSFLSIFAVTQIPLAIVEGIVTVIIFDFVFKYCKEEISMLSEEI